MSSLFPVLSETGRRWWLLAAAVIAPIGIAVAVIRDDWTAVVLIAVATVALVLAWRWASRAGGGEE